MSPIISTILPRGPKTDRKNKVTQSHKFPSLPDPLLSLSLSLQPGRLLHCNKFLASLHVPELNIGKVALTAITNMGWVPLFFPVLLTVCGSFSSEKKEKTAHIWSHVCQRTRAEKLCLSNAQCMSASVCACTSIQIDVGVRVCV